MKTKLWLFDPVLALQLFMLVNPLYAFPMLMKAYHQRMNVRRIALNATLTALIIAVVVTLVGPLLFRMFNISLDSLRIAGGIVLLLLGIETVRSYDEKSGEVTQADAMVSIMASPVLTGPATISFVTVKTYDLGRAAMLANVLLAFVFIGAMFIGFSFIVSKVNARLVNITSRILGLFLTAVAIEMIASGITGFLAAGTAK